MPRFIKDKNGRKIAVRVPLRQFNRMRREYAVMKMENDLLRDMMKTPMMDIAILAEKMPYYQQN